MVTNRKPTTSITAPTRARTHEGVPERSFVEVLHLRRSGEDLEKLRLERLLRWNALGLELDASGWHCLEAALELVRSTHDDAAYEHLFRREEGAAPIPSEEAEQIATRFVEDCDQLIAAGGQMALWHMLVDQRAVCFATVGDLVAEKLEEGEVGELARLLDAARCYALAAVATMTRLEDRQDARLLFLGEHSDEETLSRFAPFAVDNRMDDREERIQDAAYSFAVARTNADKIEAVELLAVGLPARAERYALSPIQRMGMIAWLARRVLENDGGAA